MVATPIPWSSHSSAPAAAAATRPPADRRDQLVALVAREYPQLQPALIDGEPCDELAGPWESATWGRGTRRVRVVCFPAGAVLSVRKAGGTAWALAEATRSGADAAARVRAWAEWLLEGPA
jgi:hypothetical protein